MNDKKDWGFGSEIDENDELKPTPGQGRYSLAVGEPSYSDNDSPTNEPINYSGGILSGINYTKDGNKGKDFEASIEIHDSNDNILAKFLCDVAKSMQEKVAGLQPYDSLSENAGLVFEYTKPEDVIYHMGTVKFPIDIIFVDKDRKIKKICRDIQPGTLATFGCANVKSVLEICGGLSDRLGISEGNTLSVSRKSDRLKSSIKNFTRLSKDLGIEKNIIIKYSSKGSDRISNYRGIPILTISNDLIKRASANKLTTDIIKAFPFENKTTNIFDFDGVLEKSGSIRVYKMASQDTGNNMYLDINGQSLPIYTEGNHKDLAVEDILNSSLLKDYRVIRSYNKSFYNILNCEDSRKMLREMRKLSSDKNNNIFIVTRFENPSLIKNIILSKYNLSYGDTLNPKIFSINKDSDANDIFSIFKKSVYSKNIKLYTDESILKRAGTPVSDKTKSIAKKIFKYFDKAYNLSDESLKMIEKNVASYEELQGSNPEGVKNTAGEYNQSSKRNINFFKEMVITVRDAINLFSEIKDSATTLEIIESVSSSTEACSKEIESIFDLDVSAIDFVEKLKSEAEKYKKLIEDQKSSLDRGKDYISSQILGELVLAD